MKIATIIACSLTIPLGLNAQGQNPEAQEKPPITEQKISIITLGTPPMPKFDIVNGKRQLKDIDNNGKFPPQVLFREIKKKMEAIPMALNVANQPFSHKANTPLTLSRRIGKGEDADYRHFITVPAIKDLEKVTVLITRRTITSSWFVRPKTTILRNDPESFPLKTMRVVNLSSRNVAIFVDGSWKGLTPQKTMIVRVPSGKRIVTYDAMFQNKKGEKEILFRNQAKRILAQDRINLVFYDNDGPRMKTRPVRLLTYMETRPIVRAAPPGQAPARPAPAQPVDANNQ